MGLLERVRSLATEYFGASSLRLAHPIWLILIVLAPLPWLLAQARPRVAWPTLDGFRKSASRSLASTFAVAPFGFAGWRSSALRWPCAASVDRGPDAGRGAGGGDRGGARPEFEHDHDRLPEP